MNVAGFIGPAYTSISRAINAQRCINLRLEIDAANGKAPISLVGLPGYRSVKNDFPSAPVRGFWRAADRIFVVVGSTLYELQAGLTHAVRGTLPSSSGIVSIADNGVHMLVVDGVGVLALTLATNDTTSAIANFPYGATHIVCVDNTMLANDPASQRFQISAVGNALSWAVLDFASAEALPDNIVALIGFNRQVYIMGSGSMQVFWDSGDSTRPFIPLEGSDLEVGCIAPRSLAKDKSFVYWLGADPHGGPQVYKAAGGTAGVISTPAMDAEMAGHGLTPAYVLEDAQAFTFRMDGHSFYVLTFPTSGKTWVWDAATEGWSEYLEWEAGEWLRHRANCTIYAFGKQLAGDFQNGKLYELSSTIYSNDGREQRALRAAAHLSQDEANLTIGNLQVVCEHGVGLTVGQGSDPKMMLRTSKDGGNNWTPEMTRPIGKTGAFKGRTRWNRPCGAARDIVFEVSISDPIKRVIVKAVINGD